MLKLFTIGIFSFALTVSVVAQEQNSLPAQDTSTSSAGIPGANSAVSMYDALLRLTLAPLHGDSSDFDLNWNEAPAQFKSWMIEPKPGRPAPPSLELLLGQSPSVLSEPAESPFQSRSWMLQSKPDLLSPWRLELKDQEKYQVWRSILGSVQMGGMAYLLYMHIRKYGLR